MVVWQAMCWNMMVSILPRLWHNEEALLLMTTSEGRTDDNALVNSIAMEDADDGPEVGETTQYHTMPVANPLGGITSPH